MTAGLTEITKLNDKAVLNNCMHVFCVDCISRWAAKKRVCPLCKVTACIALLDWPSLLDMEDSGSVPVDTMSGVLHMAAAVQHGSNCYEANARGQHSLYICSAAPILCSI